MYQRSGLQAEALLQLETASVRLLPIVHPRALDGRVHIASYELFLETTPPMRFPQLARLSTESAWNLIIMKRMRCELEAAALVSKLPVSINVTPWLLNREDMHEQILDVFTNPTTALADAIAEGGVVIEITEFAKIHPRAFWLMDELYKCGVHFSLDDVGQGGFSDPTFVSRLLRLPIRYKYVKFSSTALRPTKKGYEARAQRVHAFLEQLDIPEGTGVVFEGVPVNPHLCDVEAAKKHEAPAGLVTGSLRMAVIWQDFLLAAEEHYSRSMYAQMGRRMAVSLNLPDGVRDLLWVS